MNRPGVNARRFAGGRLFLPALAFGLAVVAGCSGLDPEQPIIPPGGSSPCSTPLAIFAPLANGLTWVGTDTTLDLATWNMEFFPQVLPGDFDSGHPRDPQRVQQAANIINTLGLDLIAVQEISDTTGFRELLALTPGYGGYYSSEGSRGYQKVGFIFRKDQVTVHSAHVILDNDSYALTRAPLQADLTITSNGRPYDLKLLIVHLKAGSTSEDADRRRAGCVLMKTYLDQQAALDPEANFMIAGDWNDILNDPISDSSFPVFLNDSSDYKFLNFSMVGRNDLASHASNRLIDHLMVNRAACPDFSGGRVTTLRLDLLVSGYSNVSDHRPVLVQAPVFK